MAELKISFDIRITPHLAKYGLAALMLAFCAPELASESVTLSTYYPAPSGVYTNLITTNATYLARDGGGVSIGTTVQSGALNVPGTVNIGQTYLTNSDIYFNNTGHSHTGIGNASGYAAIENAANYNTLMILGRANGIGGVRSVSVWDRLDVNGSTFLNGNSNVSGSETVGSNLTVGGSISMGGAIDAPSSSVFRGYGGTYCAGNPLVYGPGVTTCPGGTYATLISGIMTKYQIIADPVNPTGEMLCCNCGALGCPSF